MASATARQASAMSASSIDSSAPHETLRPSRPLSPLNGAVQTRCTAHEKLNDGSRRVNRGRSAIEASSRAASSLKPS